MLGVLGRKFQGYQDSYFLESGVSGGGWITSPLKSEKLHRLSDKVWLAIMSNRKIPGRHAARWKQLGPDHASESSIDQFSASLYQAAWRNPERFAKLALKFPKDVHPDYYAAILRALELTTPSELKDEEKSSWEPAHHDTIETLFEAVGRSDDRNIAYHFCWIIKNRAKEEWSGGTVNKLLYYAKNHPDPEPGKLNTYNTKEGNSSITASVRSLEENAFSSVRGEAGTTIARLLWDHPDWLPKLKSGIEALVNDPHPVARVAAVEACVPVLRIDEDLAVSWFCTACRTDLRVAACEWAIEIFNVAMKTHYDQLSPIVVEMYQSERDDVAEEGAEEITARWLFFGMFERELISCQKGSVPNRKGVAQVAASLMAKGEYFEKCIKILQPLFDDSDRDVRRVAARIFWGRTEILGKSAIIDVVKQFVRSTAFKDDPTGLLLGYSDYRDSLIPHADIIYAICDALANRLLDPPGEIAGVSHDVDHYLLPLILRLYEQTQNLPEIQNKCLDMWDILFEHHVGTTRELMASIDR